MQGWTDNKAVAEQLEFPFEHPTQDRVWRPIHYLGSKLRLVDAIRALVDELDPSGAPVCDLFAGSGTASLALARGRRVIAADIQEYARVICSALLCPARLTTAEKAQLLLRIDRYIEELKAPLLPLLDYEQTAIERAPTDPAMLCDLVERGPLVLGAGGSARLADVVRDVLARVGARAEGFLATRYYGGVYFSYRQALYLDAALLAIDEMPNRLRDTCTAAVLSTASTVVNSVGKQFAQPMRPRRKDGTLKRKLVEQMCRDRLIDARRAFSDWIARYGSLLQKRAHSVLRGDFRDVLCHLDTSAVIYADPPYTRDHYSRFYHVLETLCLRDLPVLTTRALNGAGPVSRGVYRSDRHQSPFCIKSQAPSAFSELFAGARKLNAPVLLSYSPFTDGEHPRLMTIDQIVRIARNYYCDVEVRPAGEIARSRLNRSDLHLETSSDPEVFIMCRP
jgi:adenine-specific DNA methylase